MRTKVVLLGIGLIWLLLPCAARGGIAEAEFAQRRALLAAAADSASAFIFRAADTRTRSGDVTYPYRQESNLFYLTGISDPGITLLIVPRGVSIDGRLQTYLLFAPASMRDQAGPGFFSGGAVLNADRLTETLRSVGAQVKTLYASMPDIGFVNDWLNDRRLFLEQDARQEFQQHFPGVKIRNAGPLVARFRECKSAGELDLMRTAIRLTGDGIRHAMQVCRPGAAEYELQGAIEYEMTRQGARAVSFPSIVGSGPNSLVLHYDTNTRNMRGGEVVVIDVGAEFDGYAADITRTLPVSGAFTKEQREVYTQVLRAQEEVIRMIRPGVRWVALEAKAREVLAAGGFGGRMPHGVSHHLGIDAHDAGTHDTLKAGMVITVEPGIYIPPTDTAFAAGYRGFGIRIEDDVLVGEKGPVVLSADIPKDLKTIESMMRHVATSTNNHQRRKP